MNFKQLSNKMILHFNPDKPLTFTSAKSKIPLSWHTFFYYIRAVVGNLWSFKYCRITTSSSLGVVIQL